MTKLQKEQIRKEFIDTCKHAWTYEKLTQNECDKLYNCLKNCELFGNTLDNVWRQLNYIFSAFLDGCGYEPFGWRE